MRFTENMETFWYYELQNGATKQNIYIESFFSKMYNVKDSGWH